MVLISVLLVLNVYSVTFVAFCNRKCIESVLLTAEKEQLTGIECDLTDLSQHIHFLRSLPLPYLSVNSQAVVFISLLSIALDCSLLPTSLLRDGLVKEIYDHLLLGKKFSC